MCVCASCVWVSCVWVSCVWVSCVWLSCVWLSCVCKLCVSKLCVGKLCVCVQVVCEQVVFVSKLCVSKLCVRRWREREEAEREEADGMQNQKQEPHTKMWGKSYWWGPGAFACGVGGAKKAFGAFGGFDAWQTAGLNANNAIDVALVSLPAGLGSQKRVWKVWGLANGTLAVWSVWRLALVSLLAGLGVPKKRLERLEGLRPGKRQAWRPRNSYWCGLGVFACGVGGAKKAFGAFGEGFGVFACGVGGAKKAFGAFGELEASQTAGLNAKKKLLMWPWCLCLQAWGCQKGVWSVWRVWGLANGRRERQ